MLGFCFGLGLSLNFMGLEEVNIRNGQVPAGPIWDLTFQEAFRISPESGQDEHIWVGSKVAVEINRKGHIFILDPGSNRILEFGPRGNFIRQIGKEGDGPGEFQFLTNFSILTDQSAIVHEYRQGVSIFSYFDENMNFVKRHTPVGTGKALQSAVYGPTGNHYRSLYISLINNGQDMMVYSGILSSDHELVLKLAESRLFPFNPARANEPSWWSDNMAQWFALGPKGQALVAFAEDGSTYTAVTTEYVISKWDPSMKTRVVFSKQYTPQYQTDPEIEAMVVPLREEVLSSLPGAFHQYITDSALARAVQKAGFSPVKQPLFGLVALENGGLLAVGNYSAITGISSGDLFDKNGRFMGPCKLPKIGINLYGGFFGIDAKLWFKNGKAYAIETNQEGEHLLVCYDYQLVSKP